MKVHRSIAAIAILPCCFGGIAAGEVRPSFVFDSTIGAIEGDLSLLPRELSVGDVLSVKLSPRETEWEESADFVLRDLSVEGAHLHLTAPASRVELNNYSFLPADVPAKGFGLGCFSQTDSEGCGMGLWRDGPPYYFWSARLAISVSEDPFYWPESAQWPAYTQSAEAWNLSDAVRSFEISVWEERGNVGPSVLTITSEVGVVSLAVPEPAAFAVLLTLAAATIRRRRS